MTLTVQIDDGACLAHGDCVHAAPGVFELTGDVAEQVGPGTDDQLRAAARACPAGAIILFDAQTGEEVDSVVTGPVRPAAFWATIVTRRTSPGTRSRARRVVRVLVVPSARVTATM